MIGVVLQNWTAKELREVRLRMPSTMAATTSTRRTVDPLIPTRLRATDLNVFPLVQSAPTAVSPTVSLPHGLLPLKTSAIVR